MKQDLHSRAKLNILEKFLKLCNHAFIICKVKLKLTTSELN